MPLVDAKGIKFFYESRLVKEAHSSIVFVHGSGGMHNVWQKQLTGIAANVVALDLPGHGSSSGPACTSISASASFVRDFLPSLNLPGPIYMAGHSMGAAIVLYMARYYPESLDGIILIGGGSRLRVVPFILEGLARGEVDPNFMRAAFAPATDPQLVENYLAQSAQIPTDLMYTDFTACDNFDLSDELSSINKPALIIVGEQDLFTPVKYSQFLHQNLSSSILKIIPDAGHFVMVEKPIEVNQAIAEFVSRNHNSIL
jgi:pimeloyl-ACP methyl ester carboxylesterase